MLQINNEEYDIVRSFYRTCGASDQKYFSVDDVNNNNIPNIFHGRVFHIVKDRGNNTYFVKEYLENKHIGFLEYNMCKFFESSSITMKAYDYDDGKILCEHCDGVKFTSNLKLSRLQFVVVLNELIRFIELLIKYDMNKFFEVNYNNIIINEEAKSIKIVDLETDESRYHEFARKNNKILGNLLKVRRDFINK